MDAMDRDHADDVMSLAATCRFAFNTVYVETRRIHREVAAEANDAIIARGSALIAWHEGHLELRYPYWAGRPSITISANDRSYDHFLWLCGAPGVLRVIMARLDMALCRVAHGACAGLDRPRSPNTLCPGGPR